MKRICVLICILMCIGAFGACAATEPSNEVQQTIEISSEPSSAVPSTILLAVDPALSSDEWVAQNKVIPDVLPTLKPETIQLQSEEEILGELTLNEADSFPLEYRYCYYYSYSSYWTLVDDQDAYDEWAKSVPRIKDYYPNGPKLEMPLVTLIKHFKISKDVFEAEVERIRGIQSSFEGVDLSLETQEYPNADIIYTFDNDIINDYYRRKQAVF